MNKSTTKKRATKLPTRRTPEEKGRLVKKVNILRQSGLDVPSACKQTGIAESQYYDWKKNFGEYAVPTKTKSPIAPTTEQEQVGQWSPQAAGLLGVGEAAGQHQRIEGLVLDLERLENENRKLKLMYMDLLLERQS